MQSMHFLTRRSYAHMMCGWILVLLISSVCLHNIISFESDYSHRCSELAFTSVQNYNHFSTGINLINGRRSELIGARLLTLQRLGRLPSSDSKANSLDHTTRNNSPAEIEPCYTMGSLYQCGAAAKRPLRQQLGIHPNNYPHHDKKVNRLVAVSAPPLTRKVTWMRHHHTGGVRDAGVDAYAYLQIIMLIMRSIQPSIWLPDCRAFTLASKRSTIAAMWHLRQITHSLTYPLLPMDAISSANDVLSVQFS